MITADAPLGAAGCCRVLRSVLPMLPGGAPSCSLAATALAAATEPEIVASGQSWCTSRPNPNPAPNPHPNPHPPPTPNPYLNPKQVLDAAKAGAIDFDFFINLSDADLSLRTDAEMRAIYT